MIRAGVTAALELRPVDRRDQEAGSGPQGKDDRRHRDAALPDRRPCLRNGLLARDARVRRIEHVRQREPWNLEQFCELRRDRVDTEHGRSCEEAEQDEVEPQVEERDDPADLRPQAVPAQPPTELVGGARRLAEEAASSEADPRGNERGDIGEQESADECRVTAEPGDPQQAVRREKHQLLVDDDDVRATQVAAALGARLGGCHEQLGEHRRACQRDEGRRDTGEEPAAGERRQDPPPEERAGGSSRDRGRADRRREPPVVMGRTGEEVCDRAGQSRGSEDADERREHAEQRIDPDRRRPADPGDHQGRQRERDESGNAGADVRRDDPGCAAQDVSAPEHRLPWIASAATTANRAQTWRACRSSLKDAATSVPATAPKSAPG